MALHRDIYWVGRQWAVTGFGIQAIDQRLKGSFDIEVSRVWDEIVVERTRALAWLNAADFDKAIEIARARHPGAGAQEIAAGRKRAEDDSAGISRSLKSQCHRRALRKQRWRRPLPCRHLLCALIPCSPFAWSARLRNS